MRKAAILTALEVEYLAVRAHLRDVHEETHRGTVYERGRFDSEEAQWEVVLVQTGMGNPTASSEAEKIISYFAPHLALFIGVAGGLKDLAIGDVVAATKVYGYEFGKAGAEFAPRPNVG